MGLISWTSVQLPKFEKRQQFFQNLIGMELKTCKILPTCFYVIAMYSVEHWSLLARRSLPKDGPPST